MADANALPEKLELVSIEEPRRNWKAVLLTVGCCIAVISLLTVCLISFLLLWKTPVNSTRREEDFLRFETDGDIGKITVQSYATNSTAFISLANGTTVERSAGGVVVLKALNEQFITVNATSRRITVHSPNTHTIEVDAAKHTGTITDARQKVLLHFGVTQTDNDGAGVLTKIPTDEYALQIILIVQKHRVTLHTVGGNVTFAESSYPTTLERRGMQSAIVKISTAPGTTIFEHRDSGDIALILTNDPNATHVRMRIRPSQHYVAENGTHGNLYIDGAREIRMNTLGGSYLCVSRLKSKYIKFENSQVNYSFSFPDENGQFDANNEFVELSVGFTNKSVKASFNGGEFAFVNYRHVTASKDHWRLTADMSTGDIPVMTDGVEQPPSADSGRVLVGPLGTIHKVNNVITKITTKAVNLTRSLNIIGFVWDFVVEMPAWRLLMSDKGTRMVAQYFSEEEEKRLTPEDVARMVMGLGSKISRMGHSVILLPGQVDLMDYVGSSLHLWGPLNLRVSSAHANFQVDNNLAEIRGILANVSITHFPFRF